MSVLLGLLGAAIVGLGVFEIAALWKMFKKMGMQGWKCLIPVYNSYEQTKYTCKSMKIFWAAIGVGIVGGIAKGIAMAAGTAAFTATTGIALAAAVICALATIYITAKSSIAIAHSFGRSTSFGILTLLVPEITIPVLAFGGSQYVGRSDVDLF